MGVRDTLLTTWVGEAAVGMSRGKKQRVVKSSDAWSSSPNSSECATSRSDCSLRASLRQLESQGSEARLLVDDFCMTLVGGREVGPALHATRNCRQQGGDH